MLATTLAHAGLHQRQHIGVALDDVHAVLAGGAALALSRPKSSSLLW